MHFTVLARVVAAAACVTLVAASTLERREPDDSSILDIIDTLNSALDN